MKHRMILIAVLTLALIASCKPEAEPVENAAVTTAATTDDIAEVPAGSPVGQDESTTPSDTVTSNIEEPIQPQESPQNLPLLPALRYGNTNGIGDPIPGGAADPFVETSFTLRPELPSEPGMAYVEQHIFSQLDEARARQLADQLGFNGPLYVQQIAPEFAPPEGSESPIVYTAFDGQRILNISDTGLTMEDRSVIVDYSQRPVFAEIASVLEAKLKASNLLNFPYEIRELFTGEPVVYRLIDGLVVEQNEFNILLNQAGEIAYLDYHPMREIASIGSYPLRTAEEAWQQLQTPAGRAQMRYQLVPHWDPDNDPSGDFISPRSWAAPSEIGQEAHLYMTPAVYKSTDGNGLRISYGNLTLAGNSEDLAEIASHLTGVLHVWGTIGQENGAKVLAVAGWEEIDMVQYENPEGTIVFEGGQALLETAAGETLILSATPKDLPAGTAVFVSATGRRDTGAAYPVLDWLSIHEKIDWPEEPVPESAIEEPTAISEVFIDSVSLIYFTLYQAIDAPLAENSRLFVPVWKFTGETDRNEDVTFWVPAVAPEYMLNAPLPAPVTDSSTIELPSACLSQIDESATTGPFINLQDGYCFHYPVEAGFRIHDVLPPGIAAVWGPPLTPTFEPIRAGLTVYKQGHVAGQTLDEVVGAVVEANPGARVVDAAATFAGEPAQVVEGIEGMMDSRRVYVIYSDFVYEITLVPLTQAGEFEEAVMAQRELLWETVSSSFTWLPVETAAHFAACPQLDMSSAIQKSPYINPLHGYCFVYPSHYGQQDSIARDMVVLTGPALDPTIPDPLRSMVTISALESAEGRSVQQVVDELIAEAPGLEIQQYEAILGSEPAILVTGLPARMEGRDLFFIHNDTIFRLRGEPLGFPELAEDLEETWDIIMSSFRFFH